MNPTTQQRRSAKPDENLERLRDSRHYAKHTRIALAAAFSVFVVLVGGILLWLLLTRGPTIVADRFIELVSDGKIDRAYVEASSIELRQRLTFEQFTGLVDRLQLARAKSATWTVGHKDAERAGALGLVVLEGGTTETVTMSFVAEFDDWKVDSFDLAAPVN
jgi:hypothetical protein